MISSERKRVLAINQYSKWKYHIAFTVFTLCLSTIFILNYIVNNSGSGLEIQNGLQMCPPSKSNPVLFNMRTKLGVSYSASHWFHIAENFMTYHSILREKGLYLCNSDYYYNFDKIGFVNQLNGITKLMIVLGTFQIPSAKDGCTVTDFKFNFIYHNNNPGLFTLSKSDSIKVSIPHDFTEHQFEEISQSVSTDKKFVTKAKMTTTSRSKFRNDVNSKSRYLIELSPIYRSNYSIATRQLSNVAFERNSYDISCVNYVETIGGMWPTPQRGHWFPNAEDVDSFRQKLSYLCSRDESLLKKYAKKRQYKLVIYQRDISRKIGNLQDALEILRRTFAEDLWEIEVILHQKDRPPCDLAHLLNDVDVLLTPHGFQSMLLLLLPQPSVLFEIFPYRKYRTLPLHKPTIFIQSTP